MIREIRLIPISERIEENEEFINNNPSYTESIHPTIEFYKKVGFAPPWIGYYAKRNGEYVGAAGFKGPPVSGTVEVAYGTFEEFQNQGVGTEMCRQLVELSLQCDPFLKITARTIEKENFSTKVLEKNGFKLLGKVVDPEDGEVWEWIYKGMNN